MDSLYSAVDSALLTLGGPVIIGGEFGERSGVALLEQSLDPADSAGPWATRKWQVTISKAAGVVPGEIVQFADGGRWVIDGALEDDGYLVTWGVHREG